MRPSAVGSETSERPDRDFRCSMTEVKEVVDFIWMPREGELEELWKHAACSKSDRNPYLKHSSVSSFCQFIRKTLGIRATIKDVHPKTNASEKSKDPVANKKSFPKFSYYDPLFIVTCELILESDSLDSKIKLINMFCAKKYFNNNSQSWLSLNMSFLTETLKLDNFIAYREASICSFSLGSIVGLNTFVTHVNSASFEKFDPKYKITQIRAMYIDEWFEIYFNLGNTMVPVAKRDSKTHQFFKLCFSHTSLHQLLICHDGKDFSLYLHYLEGPLLYKAARSKSIQDKKNKTNNEELETDRCITFDNMDCGVKWFRVVNLFEECTPKLRQELAMNFTLRLQFKHKEYTFTTHLLEQFCKHTRPYFTPMEIVADCKDIPIRSITSNHYNCFYALKCITSRDNTLVDQMTVQNNHEEVNTFLGEKCKENSSVLAEAIIHIYNQIDQGNVLLFLHAVKTLYNKHLEESKLADQNNSKAKSEPDKIVCIKRAILMPTHARFLPPQPQLYNRILRCCNPDYLMRVTIKDNNLDRIDFTLKSQNQNCRTYSKKFIDSFIMKRLAGGIKLGKRTYNYLGMSSSQLKSHSVWCYALDPERKKSIEEVRKDLGDLDKISEVPKFMARMGQSFSQAMGRIIVPQEFTNIDDPEPDIEGQQKIYMSEDEDDEDLEDMKVKKSKKLMSGEFVDEPDKTLYDEDESEEHSDDSAEVKPKHDPYIFSDGIGRMSQEIAEQIFEELELDERPSAFQVRYAGCKGMLVIDPTLHGKKILFRKSMKKYDSKDDSLEILKVSRPRMLYLNRPLITILDQKGIKKEVFMVLQKQMIHSSIKSMFYDEDAKEMLKTGSLLRLNFDNLMKKGLSFTEDPLFRSMILAIFKNRMYLLKTKARIAIPEDQGRNMFGVLDETKTLEYGQVFIQYTISDGSNEVNTCVLKGNVVVTKSPCLHPGDVRNFEAVDVPALHHIKDCIVFPAKGMRPHPDEMAGSDLDGDEYTVIWYEDLVFLTDNSPPMHYATPKKLINKTGRPIQIFDELNHFCNYILNDSVGRLANAHLAKADSVPKGIWSKVCIKIAKKHAKAVDFAKSGQPANMTVREMAYTYPDFMEKFKRSKTYVSDKALGHLYRSCKNLEFGLEATTDNMEFQLDDDLKHESWQNYKDAAERTYRRYCKKVGFCLKTYSIANEGEFLSGNFINRTKLISDNNERMNFQEMLEFEVKWLLQLFEKEFFEEFGGRPSSKNPQYSDEMLQKASAWYVVSYSGKIYGETRYFGLPWMVADVLATLKEVKRKEFYCSSNILNKKASYIEMAIDQSLINYGLHSLEDDVAMYKNGILESARTVLNKWLKCQKENMIMKYDFKKMEEFINEEFEELSDRLICAPDNYVKRCQKEAELRKLLSPGHYVLSTLINISEMGTGHEDISAQFSSSLQEFGLCAWVTLIRLACSCNVQYLGISDNKNSLAPLSFYKNQEIMYDLFIIEVKDDLFWKAYIEDSDQLKQYLMKTFKLIDITLHVEPNYKNSLGLLIAVKGSPYAVHCIKYDIVKPDFIKHAVMKLGGKYSEASSSLKGSSDSKISHSYK